MNDTRFEEAALVGSVLSSTANDCSGGQTETQSALSPVGIFYREPAGFY